MAIIIVSNLIIGLVIQKGHECYATTPQERPFKLLIVKKTPAFSLSSRLK